MTRREITIPVTCDKLKKVGYYFGLIFVLSCCAILPISAGIMIYAHYTGERELFMNFVLYTPIWLIPGMISYVALFLLFEDFTKRIIERSLEPFPVIRCKCPESPGIGTASDRINETFG